MIHTASTQSPTRVLIACAPPILSEVVSLALGELPNVRLVESNASDTHIVVASVDHPSREVASLPSAVTDKVHLILFDPAANLLGLRRAGGGLELRSGGLETVLEVVQRWSET